MQRRSRGQFTWRHVVDVSVRQNLLLLRVLEGGLPSKNEHLSFWDLECSCEVSWNPDTFLVVGSILPLVHLDVVDLDRVNGGHVRFKLVPSSETQNEVFLENAKRSSCSWHIHFSYQHPTVACHIVSLAVFVACSKEKSAKDVDGAWVVEDSMTRSRIAHARSVTEVIPFFFIHERVLEVVVLFGHVASYEEESPFFRGHWARVNRDFELAWEFSRF